MATWNDIKIRPRLLGALLLTGLLPLTIVAWYSLDHAGDTLETAAQNQLETVRTIKAKQMQRFYLQRQQDLELLAQSPAMLDLYGDLHTYDTRSGVGPSEPFPVDTEEYRELVRIHAVYLKAWQQTYGYLDVQVICAAHGHVMLTLDGKADLGANLSSGSLQGSVLGRVWKSVVTTPRTTLADFEPYAAYGGEPASFLATPGRDDTGQLVAVVALELTRKGINDIMQERSGMGQTGETYLVGSDRRMRSDSFLDPEKHSVAASFAGTIAANGADSEPVRLALAGNIAHGTFMDYRGVPVVSSAAPLDILGVRWVVVAEIDKAETQQPIAALGRSVVLMAVVAAVAVGLFAWWLAGSIAGPLSAASTAATGIAAGHLDLTVSGVGRGDELGDLARAFTQVIASSRDMATAADRIASGDLTAQVRARSERDALGQSLAGLVSSQRTQIGGIVEGANTLAAAISEILASTTQLAASSAESATAVSETTTTVEQVRQTAELSSRKATEVADGARQVETNARAGRQAIDDITAGMGQIRTQTEAVAESIVRLSEQSQAIADIVSTVDDLAEQSNLLAVNAAIEAARAGEEGKGFAVVAQEIKSLADQSKQATARVRGILDDIQKATSTAVMAAERSGKAVESGVLQSASADEAIQALGSSVAEAARAAAQIAVSGREQMAGVEQVLLAMENIQRASTQNAASTQQVETSAQSLNSVGQDLKAMVAGFRLT